MTIEFYFHPQSPPSQSVWMILKELGIDYEENIINLFQEEHKTESYRAISPFQKVPAIVDGDLKLSESRAIAIYLCTKYERSSKKNTLYPKDEIEIARMNMRIYRDIDNLNTLVKYMNGEAVYTGKATGPLEDLYPKVQAILTEMNEALSKSRYFWGEYLTILDFFVLTSMGILTMVGFEAWDEYPHLLRWHETMKELPYYNECYEKPLQLTAQMFKGLMQKASDAISQEKIK